jgi:peptidoglycan/LPS O-acetylase OafA/YrhL
VCYLLDRGRFVHEWSNYFDRPFLRLLLNITFFSQAWGHNTIAFTNIPYWSLGYECVYYVLYGFVFFLRGWKRIAACIALAAMIGPQVMFLMPIWWLGCWMYDACWWSQTRPKLHVAAGALLSLVAAAALFTRLAGSNVVLSAPYRLLLSIAALRSPLALLGIPPYRATMFAIATGSISAIILFLGLLAVEPLQIDRNNIWAKWVRRIADGTFTIYLLHYPMLLLANYAGLFRYAHPLRNALVVTTIVILLIVLSSPLDSLKSRMRHWLRATLPDRNRATALRA